MNGARQRRIVTGAFLIVLGLVLFAMQYITGLGDWVVLMVIGGAFLAAYFQYRTYGFLVPGGILTGLGLGMLLEELITTYVELELLGLGLGFVSIWVIARLTASLSHPWPLIPGGILLAIALVPESDVVEWLFTRGWPLVIVLVGALIVLTAMLGGGDASRESAGAGGGTTGEAAADTGGSSDDREAGGGGPGEPA